LSRNIRQLVTALILIACALILMTNTGSAQAREPRQYEAGGGELFHDAMLAFTLGHYHYTQGNYQRALGYFEQSVENLPELAFEFAPEDYANVYRMLGKTQAALKDHAGARLSFEHYLALAGATADPAILVAMTGSRAV
jgi:tetratricopeptide (TPR) repeat protein